MRGCPVIIAVFQIGPHAFPLQSPCGFSREGRKEGGVRDCLLQRVQMPGYYFLIAPPGVLATLAYSISKLIVCRAAHLPPGWGSCPGKGRRSSNWLWEPKIGLIDPTDCPRSRIALGPQMSRRRARPPTSRVPYLIAILAPLPSINSHSGRDKHANGNPQIFSAPHSG